LAWVVAQLVAGRFLYLILIYICIPLSRGQRQIPGDGQAAIPLMGIDVFLLQGRVLVADRLGIGLFLGIFCLEGKCCVSVLLACLVTAGEQGKKRQGNGDTEENGGQSAKQPAQNPGIEGIRKTQHHSSSHNQHERYGCNSHNNRVLSHNLHTILDCLCPPRASREERYISRLYQIFAHNSRNEE
jgi:hypothetical protein